MKRHESLRATIATTAACAGFALAAFVGPPVPAHAAYFGYMDIPADHWAAQSHVIDYAVDRGLLTGYSGTNNWGPDDQVTRGQMACIMQRICGPEDAVIWYDYSIYESPFNRAGSFVKGKFHEDAMSWAYKTGLIKGSGSHVFPGLGDILGPGTAGQIIDEDWTGTQWSEPYVRGDDAITREELTVMLQRLAEHRGDYSASDADYAKLDAMTDAGSVSSWARESMAWAVGKGLITGKPGNVIDPQGMATRAEASKMLMVYMKGAGFDPTQHEKVWVEGKIWTSTPYWTCDTIFGNGCGATSDVSRDAIQHSSWCGINKGETVFIAESYTDPHWVDLATAQNAARDTALNEMKDWGLLEGWYDYA